jgi:preprotein translocase subunit YajC
MFISTAYAQDAMGVGGGSDFFVQLIPILAIVVIFYFLLIRPQQKRAKQHREALASIRRSDRVITNGGLVGTVIRVNEEDETLTVEIADNVRVQVIKTMVAEVRAKGEPITAAPANDKKSSDKKAVKLDKKTDEKVDDKAK